MRLELHARQQPGGDYTIRIHAQEGIQRGCGELGVFNGVNIRSVENPEWDWSRRTIFIRGTHPERDEYTLIQITPDHLSKIISAVRAFNGTPAVLKLEQRDGTIIIR